MDYWAIVRQRNSINNNGMKVASYVHYYDPTYGFPNNAAWFGGSQVMCFGDGDGFTFNAVVALDVTAHELGHGICQFTANLQNNGEASALNEGLSDIWGAVVEHWAAPNKQNWLMGEEIMANGAACLRSLVNPKTGGWGSNTGGYPNTYHGQFWDNGGEPHTNSTVLSHWFYLLSVGGCGHIDDNTNNGAYTVFGISIEKAASIVYQAESHYLTSSANYASARTAMISAATDLYGASSNEVAQVTNAWYAAGVGAAYTGSASPIISSYDPVCSNSNFTLNVPPGLNVTGWSSSNPNGLSIDPNTGVATRLNNFNGSVTISATINGDCGVASVPKDIWVGLPNHPGSLSKNINNPPFCVGATIGVSINPVAGASSLTWASGDPSILEVGGSGTYGVLTGDAVGGATFSITAGNGCGTVSTNYHAIIQDCSGGGGGGAMLAIYPNPTSSTLTVQVIDSLASNRQYELDIMDRYSRKVFSVQSKEKLLEIPIGNLPPDIYYLNLFYNGAVIQKQIVITK